MDAVAVQPGAKETYSVERLKAPALIGHTIPIVREPLDFILSNREKADIVIANMMGRPITILFHPDLFKYVMVDNHKNYAKGKWSRRFELALGNGLFTIEGENWRRGRQAIQPMFNKKYVTGIYFNAANESAERCKQKWLQLTESGSAEVSLYREMFSVSSEVIAHAIFGRMIDDESIEKIDGLCVQLMDYLKRPRPFLQIEHIKRALHHPGFMKFQREREEAFAVIKRFLEESRAREDVRTQTMMGLMLRAQEEDPENFNDDVIIDHVLTMMFAGFETTALAMHWLFYAVEEHPDILARLRSEISRCVPVAEQSDSSGLAYEDLTELSFLKAACRETLRLYPPLWGTSRRPLADDVIGGVPVAKDSSVVICHYAMMRHPAYWEDANTFNPDRFLDGDNPVVMHPGIYFPFSQGPRKCVGAAFAEMEMLTVLSRLLACFDVKCINKENNPLDPGIALRLKEPLRARISRRVH